MMKRPIIEYVKEILDLLDNCHTIREIEIEKEDLRLRIKQNRFYNQEIKPSQTLDEKTESIILKAPIVGTFYLGINPETEEYYSVNDKCKRKDILFKIVAMKVHNERSIDDIISIDYSTDSTLITGNIGDYNTFKIKQIKFNNEQSVEYGEDLFILEPIE
jgi:biotin carboxyl carrier protein